jgi:hypothetical protein
MVMTKRAGRADKGTSTRRRAPSATRRRSRTYKKRDFASGDGMLTTVWGPSMWHYLHTMSFNYPTNPSAIDKKHYRDFMLSLQHTLPCKHCRNNLQRNYRESPLEACVMKNRDTFSRYVYALHERINRLLGKKSGLSYCDVRERYEHFRSRCTDEKPRMLKPRETSEKGCTEPLYGKKAKCVIRIVPQDTKCKTLDVDDKCIKKRG